jgi:hypothetical protein
LQGASSEETARLQQQLEQTKAKLESADDVQLATLTKHELIGNLLYGTVFNYFALNDLQDQIAAQSSGIISYRLPSYGTFSTNLKTDYFFGVPRNVKFAGLSMDIDRIKMHHVAKNNSTEEQIVFSQNIGARQSAMEHLVPEQMFSTETNKAQGVSAAKALAIASAEGQKIFTITQSNLELALSKINISAESENDIRNAVNTGKVVTTHEARINFNGWIGEGYTVIDPSTGAGGYLIAGGGNGGETSLPNPRPLGMETVDIVAASPAVAITKAQSGNAAESVTFFGLVKCKAEPFFAKVGVKDYMAFLLAMMVLMLFFKRLIQAAILIPELGISVSKLIQGVILSSMVVAGASTAAQKSVMDECNECDSGIISEYGQCWVCSKIQYAEIKTRQKINRTFQTVYGGCRVGHKKPDLLIRVAGWTEIVNQRAEEIACWVPEHQGHLTALANAEVTLNNCAIMLGASNE